MYPFDVEINGSEEGIGFTEGFMNTDSMEVLLYVYLLNFATVRKKNNSCSETPVNN